MKTLLIFLTVLVGCAADGQQPSFETIDPHIVKLMDTAHVTGLCVGLVQDNRVVYVKAYGYKNKAAGTMNDTATCFYAASFSKAVFAYLVMQLVDSGIIDLDKPLYTYLPKPIPEYDNYKDLAGDDRWKLITARECLDHTTGFPNSGDSLIHEGTISWNFFSRQGSDMRIRGRGMVLLQLVVETVTGKSLDCWRREKIFHSFRDAADELPVAAGIRG
jgi:CubicO group peptidase (beta-lactamase class C family)